MKSIVSIFTFAFCGLISSCQFVGTDTGNPTINNGSSQCDIQTSCATTPYVDIQVGSICKKLNSCFGIENTVCDEATKKADGLQFEIDLQVKTYAELALYWQQGLVVTSKENFDMCQVSVSALDCDSVLVQESIAIVNEIDFRNIHTLLRANSMCRSAFKIKEK